MGYLRLAIPGREKGARRMLNWLQKMIRRSQRLASPDIVADRIAGKNVVMQIRYKELRNLVFPLIENVCKRRGLPYSQVSILFNANCPKCGAGLDTTALATCAAAMVHGIQQIASCPRCGHDRLEVVFSSLQPEEMLLLAKDRYFSRLLRRQRI